jgi:Ran GTPase-activating protein (RanGAP) involved in mRNA processing and transport
LAKHPTLEHADLSSILANQLAVDVPTIVAYFADMLESQPALVSIDFSNNALGNQGAVALEPIFSNLALSSIKLNNCGLGKDGCETIGKALSSVPFPSKIRHVDMGSNLMLTGCSNLTKALERHKHMV